MLDLIRSQTAVPMHVYSYRVNPSHTLLSAAKNAAACLSEMPEQLQLIVKIASQESAKLPDAVLLCAASGDDPTDPIGVINSACATVELAARYSARTVHPVIASGDMNAACAWARSPAVKAECLAAMDSRLVELEAERDALPSQAIH